MITAHLVYAMGSRVIPMDGGFRALLIFLSRIRDADPPWSIYRKGLKAFAVYGVSIAKGIFY
jgi:hypothetical protein